MNDAIGPPGRRQGADVLRLISRVAAGACLLLAPAVVPTTLHGQVTASVPLESMTHEALTRLRQLGLLDHFAAGQAPVSRRYAILSIADARANLGRRQLQGAERQLAERLIAQLEAAYGVTTGSDVTLASRRLRVDRVQLDATLLDSPSRQVGGAGTTVMEADVNPLVDGRGGREFARRATAAAEAALAAETGRRLAFTVTPRLSVRHEGGTVARVHADLPAWSARTGGANVLLSAGRIPMRLGQGVDGGLFVSGNARPLDMIQLASDVPGCLPGMFRMLGPLRGVLFLADLGGDQDPPHARLAGWKVTATPASNFEFGVSVTAHTGGSGGPPATFTERVIDLLPLVDVLLFQDRDLLFSNKLAGLDARWRPWRRGVEVYVDAAVDDFDVRRIRSSLWDDGAYIVGMALPNIGPEAALAFDLELQRTGIRFYEHAQFRSGVTNERRIIGLPLGPRGRAVTSRVTWNRWNGLRGGASLTVEERSQDQYMTVSDADDDSGFRFVKVEDRAEETRVRVLLSMARPVSAAATVRLEAGGERVGNFAFDAARSRSNGILRLILVGGF